MSDDTLSEVLRGVRLMGAVFFAVDARSPWVAETPSGQVLAPYLRPDVDHVIQYHLVSAGSCWAGLIDEPALRLQAGDVIVFPQGDQHVMSSAPGMRGVIDHTPYDAVVASRLPVAVSIHGSGNEKANVICGFLGCDSRPFNPLLTALPRVVHVPESSANAGTMRRLIELAYAESSSPRSGGESVLARLSELLFIEVVRHYVGSLPAEKMGWLAGLRDPQVGRALARLHGNPTHPWTLEELAKQAGLSRSMLAERFLQFVGVPPMQYLAQWRMQLAASLLSGSNASVAEVAERVGYGSEAALSRAFKRWVGSAPSAYRQSKRGGARVS